MLYIAVLLFLCGNTVAVEQADNVAMDSSKLRTGHNEEDDNRPPVEVGPGGTIKMEKSYRTEAEAQSRWHSHLQWDSRYVSEGRDNLSGHGLYSLSSEFIIDDIAFVPWLARGPAVNFTELDLNFIYSRFVTKKLALSLGYTHLRFYYQGEYASDNEIGIDLGYQLLPQLTVSAVVYYSFEAEGSFTEIVSSYYGRIDNRTNYNVAVSLGANADYIVDGHNGVNHIQLQATTSYMPFIQLEIYASAGYNQAINRDVEQFPGDQPLGNFFWAGVGMVYLF